MLALAVFSNKAHASSSFRRGHGSKFAFGVSMATAPITTWKQFPKIMMSSYATPTQGIAYRMTPLIKTEPSIDALFISSGYTTYLFQMTVSDHHSIEFQGLDAVVSKLPARAGKDIR